MSDHSSVLKKLQWKLVLPAIMLAVATALFYLNQIWLRGASIWDDLPVTSARGMAALLTGPSPLVAAKLPAQLVGVAIFWTWSGFLLDRRLSGIREPVIRKTWLRITLYSFGLILALLLVREGSPLLRTSHRQLDYLWRCLNSSSPRRTLLGRELTTMAQFLWGGAYTIYFSVKLWRVSWLKPTREVLKADG